MKSKLLLRIAALIMLLHTLGHTMGALTWKSAPEPAMKQVITSMLTEHFEFMGRSASIGDFYSGYGISMIGVLLLVSLLLWMLSTQPVRQMVFVLGLFLIFLGITEYIYFFPLAAAFSLLAGGVTLTANRKL